MATYFIQNTNNVEDIEQMNNVINKVNKVNTEATSNIGQLTDLNNKATELSNNIQQALPLNSELVRNTEEAKAANTNLLAVNQEATTKNTELQASLEKTKEFIEGLDGSQNIPQLRLDVTELQNGLKSNQALAYSGSSISADNTLEGRTEGMRIGGRTLVNLVISGDQKGVINKSINSNSRIHNRNIAYNLTPGKTYVGYINVTKYEGDIPSGLRIYGKVTGSASTIANKVGWNRFTWSIPISVTSEIVGISIYIESNDFDNGGIVEFDSLMLFEEGSKIDNLTQYFEEIKSFGEAEGNKISILSSGKNLTNCKFELGIWNVSPNDQKPNKQSNSNYVRSSELIDISKFNDQQISISLNGKSVEGNIKYYTKDRKYIKDVFNAPFNPVPNAFYITIHVPLSRFSKYDEFQIETGSNSTSYEPYKCDKKDILIKSPLRENDVMYEDNGQVKVYRPTEQYTFTGNETSIIKWATVKDENFIGFCITNDDIPNLTSKRSLVVCNNFPSVDGVITKRNMYIAANSVNICIEKSALATPDIEGFRAWLKANPTTIVYQLAAPTVEIVENCVDIDLDTFQEKTYFNILNSLPGSLDFKVPSNIASIVQNTAREVNNIWDVINNLLVPSLIDINKNVAMSTIKNNLK